MAILEVPEAADNPKNPKVPPVCGLTCCFSPRSSRRGADFRPFPKQKPAIQNQQSSCGKKNLIMMFHHCLKPRVSGKDSRHHRAEPYCH